MMQMFKKIKKLDQFSHLAKSVNAGKSQGIKIMLIGLICFMAIGVLLILMMNFSREYSGKSEKLGKKSEQSFQDNTMSQVFKDNEEKIRQLQQVTKSLLKAEAVGSEQPDFNFGFNYQSNNLPEAKSRAQAAARAEWLSRQNAPTEMYSQERAQDGLGKLGKFAASQSTVTELLGSQGGLLSQYQGLNVSGQGDVSHGLVLPHPAYTVAQGEFIHAVLDTAIDSELPGMVRAEITNPVYSYQGENILIPAGSRLIGQYTSKQQNGPASARVFIMWNRIITPSGISILINSPGVDGIGRSGMSADAIDHYFFQIFGQAILFSVLGAGVSTVGVSDDSTPNSADQFRQSVAGSLQASASKSLKANTNNISPTLHIYQGDSVVVFVSKDLDLFDSLGNFSF